MNFATRFMGLIPTVSGMEVNCFSRLPIQILSGDQKEGILSARAAWWWNLKNNTNAQPQVTWNYCQCLGVPDGREHAGVQFMLPWFGLTSTIELVSVVLKPGGFTKHIPRFSIHTQDAVQQYIVCDSKICIIKALSTAASKGATKDNAMLSVEIPSNVTTHLRCTLISQRWLLFSVLQWSSIALHFELLFAFVLVSGITASVTIR